VPPDNPDTVAIAELYDAWGGAQYAGSAAKKAAGELEAASPGAAHRLKLARAFHARAARWAVSEDGAAGVVFAACGYPTAPPMHAAAAEAAPGAHFVYTASDAGVTAALRDALAGSGSAVARVSCMEPEKLLGHPAVQAAGTPLSVQIQLAACFWSPDHARDVTGGYARLLPPGSTLVMSVTIPGEGHEEDWAKASERATGSRAYAHSEASISGWFEGAGMRLASHGIRDARTWSRGRWAERLLGRRGSARVAVVVARVP
jgi:S-adenosyl methyltransferase